jgi:hypothetical protein
MARLSDNPVIQVWLTHQLIIQLLNRWISSILLFVKIKLYRPLHYLLIILLVLAPFRGLLAMPSSHCDMNDMPASHQMNVEMDAMEHDGAMSHHPAQSDTVAVHHKCCCCHDGSCAGQCDMGMSVSLIVQESLYAPVIVAVTESLIASSAVLLRALTPLIRPPASSS